MNYNNLNDPGHLDEIEKIPAYKRKNSPVQTGMFDDNESESRYTIGGKDKGLKPNNPYIFDAVD